MITELNEVEMMEVDGGLAPAIAIVGYVVLGFALAAAADYLDGGFND